MFRNEKDALLENLRNLTQKLKESEEKQKEMMSNYEKYGKFEKEERLSYPELEKKSYTGVCLINEVIAFLNGWPVYDYSEKNLMQKNPNYTKPIVSTVGPYGKGKTFFHSQLSGENLPDGITYHTKGFSIRVLEDKVLMDTEGYLTPIGIKNPQKEDINMKQLDEDFRSNVILHLSDVFLFVVQHLTIPEHKMLLKIKEIINQKEKGDVFVIHNFMDVFHEEDVKKLWNEEIIEKFKGEFREENQGNPDYYIEDGHPVRHFCLFNKSAKIGKEKNPKVFKYINQFINSLNYKVNNESILYRIQNSLDHVIPNFFATKTDTEEEKKEEKSPKQSINNKKEELKEEFKYIKFIEAKDLKEEELQDNKIEKNGLIGMIKPTKNITGSINRFIEEFKGTTRNELTIHYDEYASIDEYKIIFDIPGLDQDQNKNIKVTFPDSEMIINEIETKIKEKIKIGIMLLNTGYLEMYYERIPNEKTEKKGQLSRSFGIWKKQIEIPMNFKTYDTVHVNSYGGQLIIKIPKIKDEIKEDEIKEN